ncbi:hypothetical protein K7432_014683 [Basidiobolus ranarum]|uniref:Uncharacterized protein n=1 Tax=Basidiobolus ranarum TaxID=34480 RepID=A0ABR2VPL7_9FUNG
MLVSHFSRVVSFGNQREVLGPLPLRKELLAGVILRGDTKETIRASKLIFNLADKNANTLVPFVNNLTNSITLKLTIVLEQLEQDSLTPSQIKHLLLSLLKICSCKTLVLGLQYETLRSIFERLIPFNLDILAKDLPTSDKYSLGDSIDFLFQKITRHANPNTIYRVLIHLYGKSITERHFLTREFISGPYRACGLIRKLIIRAKKSLQADIAFSQVNFNELLSDVRCFFESYGEGLATDRRVKTSLGIDPIRVVMTIPRALHNIMSDQELATTIPLSNAEKSIVYRNMISLLNQVKTLTLSENDEPPEEFISDLSINQDIAEASPQISGYRQGDSLRIQIDCISDLDQIFDLIRVPGSIREGVSRLRDFKMRFPETGGEIETRLSTLGYFFRQYVRRFTNHDLWELNTGLSFQSSFSFESEYSFSQVSCASTPISTDSRSDASFDVVELEQMLNSLASSSDTADDRVERIKGIFHSRSSSESSISNMLR